LTFKIYIETDLATQSGLVGVHYSHG